jgi:hypothetical protein
LRLKDLRRYGLQGTLGLLPGFSILAVGVTAIAWSAIFVRWTLMPGIASAFYRVFIASVALWLFLLLSGTRLLRIKWSTLCLAAFGGAFLPVMSDCTTLLSFIPSAGVGLLT